MKVAMIMGSTSDLPKVEPAISILKNYGVEVNVRCLSAHRAHLGLSSFIKETETDGTEVIITAAGMAAALPGVVASRRLGIQEPYTMGGGEFYLNPNPWLTDMDRERWPQKNTFNLKRDFTDASIPEDRFLIDLRWLVFWGYYWAPNYGQLAGVEESGLNRAFRPPEYLERTRPAVEKWARSLLAKGVPPID